MLLRTAQVSFVGSPSCSAKLQPVKVACQVQASGASYSTPRKDTRNLEPLYYPPQSEVGVGGLDTAKWRHTAPAARPCACPFLAACRCGLSSLPACQLQEVACSSAAFQAARSAALPNKLQVQGLQEYMSGESLGISAAMCSFQGGHLPVAGSLLIQCFVLSATAAIWDRRRHVTTSHGDPLLQMFDEHDVQNHG